MENVKNAMKRLKENILGQEHRQPIPFDEYLLLLSKKPEAHLRNVFQVFYEMIKHYVSDGVEEYPDDPESVGFLQYDFTKLFVQGHDHPFFSDRLFGNRFINRVAALKSGAQQNKIYIFDGPPGCGKSTFLNNLLHRFEEYSSTEEGIRYEVVWHLDVELMGGFTHREAGQYMHKLQGLLNSNSEFPEVLIDKHAFTPKGGPRRQQDPGQEAPIFDVKPDYLEIPCPSHDHPLLLIPKDAREAFIDDLIENPEFKSRLTNEKEYEWIFLETPCTICSSLYQALRDRGLSHEKVFSAVFARPFLPNRRLGEGVSVFNPGDRPQKQTVSTNQMIQEQIEVIFKDSNQVKYLFSQYARTNNGIYALMDIKSHNKERLIELHNIVSEGVHKVEHIEEKVNSLFVAVMNPEDKVNIADFQSFSDRIEYIGIPYVLDYKTEVEIYRHIFGRNIDRAFLPRVLHNFARVIISTRLETDTRALSDWIEDPDQYHLYCDRNLYLLKMDLYTGIIPDWLSEDHRKAFTAKRRRSILAEATREGKRGLSGRDSIKIFNEFYAAYHKDDKFINMSMLNNFFTKNRKDLLELIPQGFLESLIKLYDYLVLQEVKESLYYYNEAQISRDIINYLFALNFEIGATQTCPDTGDKLDITEDFLDALEWRLLGTRPDRSRIEKFRRDTQKDYASKALTQEMLLEDKAIDQTTLFQDLRERYIYNLKQKVLDPFLENENFRRAVMDYGSEDFKTYDKRIKDDVTFMLKNLQTKSGYSDQGAREVCVYVIDNDLAKKYGNG